MSKVINLFKPKANNTFTIDPVDRNRTIANEAPEAEEYLQEIKLGGTVNCCAFKDVGNPNLGGNIPGDKLTAYRFCMMTVPGIIKNAAGIEIFTGVRYVDYTFTDTLNLKEPGKALSSTIQGLAIFDIYTTIEVPIVHEHLCNHIQPQADARPIACLSPATSIQSSVYKPFHLFKVESWQSFFTGFDNFVEPPYPIYLVPFFLSEGIVVYYTIIDDGTNDVPATLETLAQTIFNNRKEAGDHWCSNGEIVYNDDIGIFICNAIRHVDVLLPIKK